ncbi:MAG: ComF family protein [Candidatus Niyogibacteria bacterium]|nr:MAG: ComF family protein [Candidatus Niyogibacteria bacterium]
MAEILFPRSCFSCGAKGKYLCLKCLTEIRDPDIFYPKNMDFALTSFSYREPAIKMALRKLKYSSASDIAEELAEIMAQDLRPYLKYDLKPIIAAIPMTERRKRARGFNQAELLACHLARILNLEHSPILIKVRETKPQAEIKNRAERLENIKGVFALKENFSPPKFAVIVDDIYTTGATMAEAGRVLKKAGVKKIICAAVAR